MRAETQPALRATVGDADLGQWLVSSGLALDWPNYSRGMYGTVTNAHP